MKPSSGRMLSRRGLAALVAAAPAAASAREALQAPASQTGPAAEALVAQESNRARLKSVKLAREVEPAFRFES